MGIRPSEYLGIHDEWAAYCLDRSVYAFGSSLQHELESVRVKDDKDGRKAQRKREQILHKWIPELKKASKPKYADPGKR
jgi:hypothetical protein